MTGLAGLVQIELDSHTAYLTDGGFLEFDGNTYRDEDSTLGTLASLDGMSEGAGDDIPALDMTFNPPDALAINALSIGGLQRKTVKVWIAEFNRDTGLVVGTPDLRFLGQIDQPSVAFRKGEYTVSFSAVSKAEWFFERDIGNGLSSSFHKSIFAGELGHDNASGLSVPIAWGTASPATSGGQGKVNRGGGPESDPRNFNLR